MFDNSKILPEISMQGLEEDQVTQLTDFLCALNIFIGEDCL